MIKVVAKSIIKVEKTQEFISLAKHLVQETRKNDVGCIRYELLQDAKTPQQIVILEEWENQDSLNEHMGKKHFKEAMVSFEPLFEVPLEINLYQTLI